LFARKSYGFSNRAMMIVGEPTLDVNIALCVECLWSVLVAPSPPLYFAPDGVAGNSFSNF